MSEVRRWAHTVTWEGLQISAAYMAINDGGEYVMHADYAALEAERETLRAENELLRQELAQSDCALRESRANDMANVRTLGDMWERHEALRQELENVLKRREA